MTARLHPDDIEAIATEVARQIQSGGLSARESPGPQETRWENEFMDHTNTERDGDASSLERMARDDVARLRRGLPLRPTSKQPAARRKAAGR